MFLLETGYDNRGTTVEGVGQAPNQDNANATGGQMELQNNGPAEGPQDQTSTQVNTERQAQGAETLEERRASNVELC